MKACLLVAWLLGLAACAVTEDPQEVEAVRDFVAANDLREVDEARFQTQFDYSYLNDHFVILRSRRDDYLVEFRRRCRAAGQSDFEPYMVDVRREPNVIRARSDSIRGCYIDRMYELSPEQARELKNLGDAPGDETFLPEESPSE